MSDLPDSWTTAPLAAVATVIMGNSPDGASYNNDGEGVPLINGPVEFTKDAHGPTKRTKFTTSPTRMCKAGDLLVCVRGATAGRTNIAAFDACIGRGVALIRARIEQSYINHFIVHSRQELFDLGAGTTFPNVSQEALSSLTVSVPPLSEQRRIVAKIEALTAHSRRTKEALDAIPPLLEKLRQSILAAAFRGDLTADWRAQHPDVEPASELLKRIRIERRQRWEESELAKMKAKGKPPTDDRWKAKYKEPEPVDTEELPELPQGWVWGELEDLCDPLRGIPYGIVLTGEPVEDGVPTVRCGDIKNHVIDCSKLKRVDPRVAAEFSRTRLLGGEVLLAIRGTVGATAIASLDMAGMNISREVAMIPPLPGLDSEYLMYLLAAPSMQAALFAQVKGVAQAGINLADLRRLVVPLPPLAEQSAIVDAVRCASRRAESLRLALSDASELSTTLDSAILSKAFRGELVPQDPNDEPASVLLERIRAENASAAKPARRKRAARGPEEERA